MKDHERTDVLTTIAVWRKYVLNFEDTAKTRFIIADYKIVLNILYDDVPLAKKNQSRFVLLARDSCSTIQTLASFCFTHHEDPEKKTAQINTLITAPWNYSWPLEKATPSLKGGGLLVFFAIFKKAQKACLNSISLHSTGTAFSFYEKLKMTRHQLNKFTLVLQSKEHLDHLDSLFKDRLGAIAESKELILNLD
jgi:hypothetical protein